MTLKLEIPSEVEKSLREFAKKLDRMQGHGTATSTPPPVPTPAPTEPEEKFKGGVPIGKDAEFKFQGPLDKEQYHYTGKVVNRDENTHHIISGDLGTDPVIVPNEDVVGQI